MSDEAPAPATTRPPAAGWLQPLGLVGLRPIEPVLLAALATEQPLLLIGPHGTAKSLLLTRVAAALGLSARHYNASLLNFDDLVGFPVPGPDRTLEYLKTPAAIWGAGAVIFDEISRCRPDVQNKLFPIIHERKVQGLAIEGLRHRWAAMNPPSQDDDDQAPYTGSEPLDTALADRFAYVVPMPAWSAFTRAEQMAVIQAEDRAIGPADAAALHAGLSLTRSILKVLQRDLAGPAADYVHALLPLLAAAGLELSPRRANMLYGAVLAVHASTLALQPDAAFGHSALLALQCGLPQRAHGAKVNEVKVLAAHREALRAVSLSPLDPLRVILATADPLERLKLAARAARLPKAEASRVVADSLAQLPPGAREAAIVHLFETGAVGRLNAAVASQIAQTYRSIATAPEFSETIHASHSRYRAWGRLKELLARLNPQEPRDHLRANALAFLFAGKALHTPQDVECAFEAFGQADEQVQRA